MDALTTVIDNPGNNYAFNPESSIKLIDGVVYYEHPLDWKCIEPFVLRCCEACHCFGGYTENGTFYCREAVTDNNKTF